MLALPIAVLLCGQSALANDAVKCFEKAWGHPDEDGRGLTRGQATTLCSGARDDVQVIGSYVVAYEHLRIAMTRASG